MSRVPSKYDRVAASRAAQTPVGEVGKTIQQFRESADINVLVRRFGLTGEMPPAKAIPQYGDFSQVVDFQTAMNALRSSQEAFDALPARIRDRFNNDPRRFLEFVHDADNRDEAVRLGLVPRPEPPPRPDPAPEPVVDPA